MLFLTERILNFRVLKLNKELNGSWLIIHNLLEQTSFLSLFTTVKCSSCLNAFLITYTVKTTRIYFILKIFFFPAQKMNLLRSFKSISLNCVCFFCFFVLQKSMKKKTLHSVNKNGPVFFLRSSIEFSFEFNKKLKGHFLLLPSRNLRKKKTQETLKCCCKN